MTWQVSVSINDDDHDLLYNLAVLLGDEGRTADEASEQYTYMIK